MLERAGCLGRQVAEEVRWERAPGAEGHELFDLFFVFVLFLVRQARSS